MESTKQPTIQPALPREPFFKGAFAKLSAAAISLRDKTAAVFAAAPVIERITTSAVEDFYASEFDAGTALRAIQEVTTKLVQVNGLLQTYSNVDPASFKTKEAKAAFNTKLTELQKAQSKHTADLESLVKYRDLGDNVDIDLATSQIKINLITKILGRYPSNHDVRRIVSEIFRGGRRDEYKIILKSLLANADHLTSDPSFKQIIIDLIEINSKELHDQDKAKTETGPESYSLFQRRLLKQEEYVYAVHAFFDGS